MENDGLNDGRNVTARLCLMIAFCFLDICSENSKSTVAG